MSKTVGIDLGTTNSEVAIVENGQARVLPGDDGDLMLPSCVGLDDSGKLVVGREALRQYAAAPERTVKSIKRWMGTDHKTALGDREYLPQDISAIILKALKQRAETALGEPVTQAVITVPAYFTDAQRQATKLAGEIAGLEVLQIINEPTAAALTYDLRSEDTEKILVYDLGGGTFDVSIVEITGEVTEVLASHGNNRLGGDDFDRRLQLHLSDLFKQKHGVDVPNDPLIQARLLRAAEETKMALSSNAFTPVREPFLATKGKTALHLEAEVSRTDFEDLIRPLLRETMDAIDRALNDAHLKPDDLDRIILVGGSTRIPLIHQMILDHLGQPAIDGIQPDLCVALGAALQAGVLAGEAVDAILVDVIPHSLGISAAVDTAMGLIPGFFSVIVPRNTVVPVSRSDVYSTMRDNQEAVEIEVFQGENPIAEENVPLGKFKIENLPLKPAGEVEIEVHFDFDINGLLTVTATEKGQGNQEKLIVNNAEGAQKLSSQELRQARADLDALFADALASAVEGGDDDEEDELEFPTDIAALVDRAEEIFDQLDDEQASDLQELLERIGSHLAPGADWTELRQELEDFLYYVKPGESEE